jgi:hypothetical protein
MKMALRIPSIAIVLMMVMGSTLFLFPGGGNVDAAPPSRALDHAIVGYINNYGEAEAKSFTVNLTVVGTINNPPNPPTNTQPFYGGFTPATYEYSIAVDSGLAGMSWTSTSWELRYTDRYGYNESNGGLVVVSPPDKFYWQNGSGDYVFRIENGSTAQPGYSPGVFGGLKFHIINGSSGSPLQGVPFFFEKHPFHSTSSSHNVTDANGDVTFNNMQLGLDKDNKVKVGFIHPHFTTNDDSGVATFPLYEGQLTTYTVTLKEKPLIRSVVPADGSIDVRNEVDQLSIQIRFNTLIDRTSVTASTVWLEDSTANKVPITYSFMDDATTTYVYLTPGSDLDFDETYTISVDTGIKDTLGGYPLWRMFTSNFTTWKAPGIIRGTVHVFGTSQTAPAGTQVWLDSQFQDTVGGAFLYDNVNQGPHTLKVVGPDEEFLYSGIANYPISVNRGDDITITDLYVYKADTVSMNVKVLNRLGDILQDANVTHAKLGITMFTGADGIAQFPEIKANAEQQFYVKAQNYYDNLTAVLNVGSMNGQTFEVLMSELPLPMNVTARDGVEVPLVDGVTVPVDSMFVVAFNAPMNPDTMTKGNIKIFDPEGDPIDVNIVNETKNTKRWYVTPANDLVNGVEYSFFVAKYVAYQTGFNPLWRDETIDFQTTVLIDSSVSGIVTVHEKGIEGLDLVVRFGSDVIGSTTTVENGAYSLSIPMALLQYTGVSVTVSGAELGFTDGYLDGITLKTNEETDGQNIEMTRLPGWMNVSYKKDDQGRMGVGELIFVTFTKKLDTESDKWWENFTIGSLALDFNVTPDGKGVIIDPSANLEYNKQYVLVISTFQDTQYPRELMFYDGTKALIRGESVSFLTEFKPIVVTLQSPAGATLNAVPKNEKFIMRFSDSVVPEQIESLITIKRVKDGEPVTNLQFEWRDDNKAVDLTHEDFKPTTHYVLSVPAGQYGRAGSSLLENFSAPFTTKDEKIINLMPLQYLPKDSQEPGQITVQLTNPVGYPILVVIGYRMKDSLGPFIELANLTLAALEPNKQVVLDLSKVSKGQYEIHIWVRDPVVTESVLNDYPLYLTITDKKGTDGPSILLIIIVVLLLIVVIAAVAGFIYMQTRKKEEEEEVREEFECPECHNTVGVNDSVCPNCGAEFEEEAYKCPKCGHMLDHDDEECGECGYDFSEQDKMEIDSDDYEVEEADDEVEELVEMEE